MNYLKEYYTHDFDVFSRRRPPYGPPSFRDEHAIGVVNLARLTEEYTLLPVAFLICCTLGLAIVHGFQPQDQNGCRETLSSDDLGLCFQAKSKLIERCISSAVSVFDPTVAKECKTVTDCRRALRETLRTLDRYAAKLAHPDPFVSIVQCTPLRKSLCSTCWAMVKQREEEERRDTWGELPTLLCLKEFNAVAEGDSADP